MRRVIYLLLPAFFVLAGAYYYFSATSAPQDYNPSIDPSLFSTEITNPYFRMPVGRKLVYEGDTEDGTERIEITIEETTREIMGVTTITYRDKVFVAGELVEDTRDYLAQDRDGNVWYFGEEVDNYENGELTDHSGSWIAGIDGAQPGIWIKGENTVGDSYRQEYYKGEAEDMRDVVSSGDKVSVPAGEFTDCIKFYDWTPLEPTSREYKYYCREIGAEVLVEDIVAGNLVELIAYNSAN